jgi:UDP-N-acetyl-D-mannosaminuronic acid transferase (WecB/TagA/CpsF family)
MQNMSTFDSKIDLNLIENINNIDRLYGTYIFSAINLTMLSCLSDGTINPAFKPYIFWPDGIGVKLLSSKISKTPGRDYLNIYIRKWSDSNVKVSFIGDVSKESHSFLTMSGLNYENITAPYADYKKISHSVTNQINSEIIVILLPTPKQELVAECILSQKNDKKYQIYCFGGALNMITGKENIPNLIDKLGFEWLWRLRYETKRRIIRLYKVILKIPKIIKFLPYVRINKVGANWRFDNSR